MKIKPRTKSEAEEKAYDVHQKHMVEWLLHPTVASVATMKDEEDGFYVAVGVRHFNAPPKVPKEIDGVQVKLMLAKNVTYSNGATEISSPMTA